MDDWPPPAYGCIAYIVGGIAFLCGWAYAIETYGWFLGGGLGWLPAAFIGIIIGLLWPLLVLAALAIAAIVWYGSLR